jgi:hypothetical protein
MNTFKDIAQALYRKQLTVEQVMTDDKMRVTVFEELVDKQKLSALQAVEFMMDVLTDYACGEVDDWDIENWCCYA